DLAARRIGVQAQVPEILSWGIAYKGFERALIDIDFRYFDYKNTSLYDTNPIKATDTLFNIQAPGFMQQMLALGVSYKLTDDIVLTAAWTHQFRNSITGPVLQIPGERIKLDAQTDSIVLGLNVQFGTPRKHPDNSVSSGETYTV